MLSPTSRHSRPVIVLHGTIVEKEAIAAYRDFAQESGHPVTHKTYPSIKNGDRLEVSAQEVSEDINRARLREGRKNLQNLGDLKEFFGLDDSAQARNLLTRLPAVVSEVKAVLASPDKQLLNTLSGRLQKVEARLASEVPAKVAAEVLEALVPKAELVGHSAGGFVAYTLAVNPQDYDGGKGLGEVILLSSPVGEGMPFPAPSGVTDLPFYMMDHNVFEPLAQLNPFFGLAYHGLGKALTKAAYQTATMVSTALSTPFIYAAKPGYEQVMEGSDFLREHVQGRPIPDGVSVLAVTSPLDRMVEADRAQLDPQDGNAHHLSVDLTMEPGELERERPTWTHVKMGTQPHELQQQFDANLPELLPRLLDPSNDDGLRSEALDLLVEHPRALPRAAREAVEKVAAESSPFLDSPARLALQVLANCSQA